MNDKLSISYHTAKNIILELLENTDFSTDEDIKKALCAITQNAINDSDGTIKRVSRLIVDEWGKIYLPDYSAEEIKMPYLPKTVFLFFLVHQEGVEFKSMYNYIQELYEIYQIAILDKNTEASKLRQSIEDLVEPVNNRIYETCSIVKKSLSMIVPISMMEHYCIVGKRGEKHKIQIDRQLIDIRNEKLKEIFETNK